MRDPYHYVKHSDKRKIPGGTFAYAYSDMVARYDWQTALFRQHRSDTYSITGLIIDGICASTKCKARMLR